MLLLLETERRRKEDEAKKEHSASEKQRMDDLHQRHLDAELELKQQQGNLQEAMERIDERLLLIEQHIFAEPQPRRRWAFF